MPTLGVASTVVEQPALIDLLGSVGPNHQVNLSSTTAQTYVKRLASLPLHDLRIEPFNIANERTNVDTELVNLCYREYSTFNSVHRCSSAVGAAFNDFDASLRDLIDSIPSLEQVCRQFAKANSQIQSQRRKAILLLENENKLLDILEIPQLMDSCVRNGYYQEALDLASHVESISVKVVTGIVKDVAEEVHGILHLMAAQLLGVLREPVKLPVLLKAVNYLRRLQHINSADLGLVFLSSRLHNYRVKLVEVEQHRGEPVRYLRKYIDLFREHVFDVISQYTTIFPGTVDDQLASFACLCVDDLVDLVQLYMPRIQSDSASMSSILVQLGYCSLSFGRVGLDFSALLESPFTIAIYASYGDAVSSAATLLAEVLLVGIQDASTPSGLLVANPHLQSILADESSPPSLSRAADPHTPPSVLAYFPPIAQFLNAHMSSLNALRMLAPFQLSIDLLAAQTTSICRASEAVLNYLQQALDSNESPRDMTRSSSGPKHTRTGSSPRAHLLRRNTETQLSSETLLARRREAKRVCVAFGNAWLHAVSFIRDGLLEVLEQDQATDDEVFQGTSSRIETWVNSHAETRITDDSPHPEPLPVDAVSSSALSLPHDSPTVQYPCSPPSLVDFNDATNLKEADVPMSLPSMTEPTNETSVARFPATPLASAGHATSIADEAFIGDCIQHANRSEGQDQMPGNGHRQMPETGAGALEKSVSETGKRATFIGSPTKSSHVTSHTVGTEAVERPVAPQDRRPIDHVFAKTAEGASLGNALHGDSSDGCPIDDDPTQTHNSERLCSPTAIIGTDTGAQFTEVAGRPMDLGSPDAQSPAEHEPKSVPSEYPAEILRADVGESAQEGADSLTSTVGASGAQPPATLNDSGPGKTSGAKKKKKKGKK